MMCWYCRHKWETVVLSKLYEKETDKYPIGHVVILRCVKCGDLERREV